MRNCIGRGVQQKGDPMGSPFEKRYGGACLTADTHRSSRQANAEHQQGYRNEPVKRPFETGQTSERHYTHLPV